jgi:hypothetical protein
MKTIFWPLPLLLSLATACGDDSGSGADAGADQDAGAYVCDPVGNNPAQSELFNAPLAEGVEVIDKTPQHPGDPGPADLP